MARPRITSIRPTLKRRRGRRAYYVSWTDPRSGKTHRESTGTEDEAEARRYLAEFILADQKERHRTATIAEVFKHYELSKQGTTAGVGAAFAWKALEPFFSDLLPEMITPALCHEYVRHRTKQTFRAPKARRARKIKASTAGRELGILRAAIRWAVRCKMIGDVAVFALPQTPEPRDHYLMPDEAEALIAAAAPHIGLFIILALATAARKSALLGLRWNRVRDGLIDLRTPSEAKTNKRRGVIPIIPGSRLARALDEARKIAQSDWVIDFRGKRCKDVGGGFARAVQRAGLPAYITPHVLKHTACVWMAQRGVPIADIAEYSSTSVPTVMKHYLVYTPDRGMRAAAALQDF